MTSLIFCGDLKYCPYAQRYIERLEANHIQYEMVFWNKSGKNKNYPSNYLYYNRKSVLSKSKLLKIKDYINFRKWILKYVHDTKSDKFILLSTLSGIIIGKELKKRHAQYLFDIRDYSYEKILPYYIIEKNVIKNSYKTVISSEKFKNFLPSKYDYILAHNFNRHDITNFPNTSPKDGVVRIVWNGLIRYFDYQSKIILALANDSRFELIYHGDGPDLGRLKELCKTNNIQNVIFTGEYDNMHKADLLANATFLNNCYGYRRKEGNRLKYAVSNKFYDGIMFCIPQIVENNGYKAELVRKYGLGIVIDLKERVDERIIEFLNTYDVKKFRENCNIFLRKVIEEDNRYIQTIDEFLKM